MYCTRSFKCLSVCASFRRSWLLWRRCRILVDPGWLAWVRQNRGAACAKVRRARQPGNRDNSPVTSWHSHSVDVHSNRVKDIELTRHTPYRVKEITDIVCEAKVVTTAKIAFITTDFPSSGVFWFGFSAEKIPHCLLGRPLNCENCRG